MTNKIIDEFKVSDSAVSQLAGIIQSEDNADIKGIRIFISGAGCGGVQYGMTFADSVEDTDSVLESSDVNVYVDSQCLATMDGIEIDFADGPNGPSFVFNNTKVQAPGCGTCGSATAGGGCG
jgi:iron-sulfur cluster insertion protein